MPPKYRCHLFWCAHERDADTGKPSCGARGSLAIGQAMKQHMRDLGLRGQVGVTKSGCLGQCSQGPAMVIYPENTWYAIKTLEDGLEIVERHLGKGEIVERLLLSDTAQEQVEQKVAAAKG